MSTKTDDPQLVAQIREVYAAGSSMRETAATVGITLTVLHRIMRVHDIPRRRAVARDQSGPANHQWQGDRADYYAMHLRVVRRRGAPSLCEECGATDGRFEWANQTGNYADPDDYRRMCVPCHRAFDAARRRETGQPTSPIATVVSALTGEDAAA